MWREFWDTVFSVASMLLAVVFGTSLGNLVRGVPLDKDGLSGMPLFTNFLPGKQPGIFDWYTTLVGLFTLRLLRSTAPRTSSGERPGPFTSEVSLMPELVGGSYFRLWVAVTLATAYIRSEVFTNLIARPWSLVLRSRCAGGFGAVLYFLRKGRELAAFLSSSAFLFGLVGSTMIGNYPFWLRSTIDPSFSLSATNTVSSAYGLRVALPWWLVGITLAAGYFVVMFRSIRGKVEVTAHGQADVD